MAIEFFMIALAVVLFGGMMAGLAFAYRDIEAQRVDERIAKEAMPHAAGLYAVSPSDEAVAQELMLRQLEHYVRREVMAAEQFIDNPTPQTLRAGARQHLGTC